MIPIWATIVGYTGTPTTLFSVYEKESAVLGISQEGAYRTSRPEQGIVISNSVTVDRDSLFTDDHLQEAISAYFMMRDGVAADGYSKRLHIHDRCLRVDPSTAIEKDGMDTSGHRYRLSENITCAQVAVLATCWYAHVRCNAVESALSMMDKLSDVDGLVKKLSSGEAFTL